jgi:hypothetical protein
MNRLSRRRRARRGTVLLELGLVGPVLAVLMLTVLEGAWQALTAATLDIGAREASRFGATGAAFPDWLPPPAPATREEAIRRVVLHFGPTVLQQDRLMLVLEAYAGPAGLATPRDAVFSAGEAGQTVVYALTYDQPLLTPLAPLLLGRSALTHTSRMVVRNEPFAP